MTDIIDKFENFSEVRYLIISCRYRGLDYLVSDKYGNLFVLPHCPNKRTIEFKQLNVFNNCGSKSIKYHQSNISFNQLKKLSYKVNESHILNNGTW